MADQNNQQQQPQNEKETVVVEREHEDKKGSNGLIALIVGVIVIFLVGWFIMSMLDTAQESAPDDVEVDVESPAPEQGTQPTQ